MPKIDTQAPPRRFHELDSLRGVAALIVVFGHCYTLYLPHVPSTRLIYPLIAGTESVSLFFVLSGLVLSLPFLKKKDQPYGVFAARRILRIYGPYFVALVMAVGGAALLHQRRYLGPWATHTWSEPVNWWLVLQHVLFLGNYDNAQFNAAFWSLVQEMRLSLVFPAVFLVGQRLGTWKTLALAFVLTVGGHVLEARFPHQDQTMITVWTAGLFLAGITIARELGRIGRWRWTQGQWLMLGASSLVAYWGAHVFKPMRHGLWCMDGLLTGTGAVGIILVAMHQERVRAVLVSAPLAWLGRISYSLYLVHATVLFGLAEVLKGTIPAAAFFALYVAVALGTAWVFFRLVEKPFIELSHKPGRRKAQGVTLVAVTENV